MLFKMGLRMVLGLFCRLGGGGGGWNYRACNMQGW
jgi:hypothetical protein